MGIYNIKHIIKILALVCLLCYVTDKIFFLILNKISDQVYTGHSIGKVNYYLKIKEDKKLLIFGNSRAENNVNPQILETNSFNMGEPGRQIAFANTLIKTIENKETQTILLHLDPEYLFIEDYKGEDIEPLAIKYHRNAVIKGEIDRLKLDNPFQHFFWSISYNSKILGIVHNYLNPKWDSKTYNGYEAINVDEKQEQIFRKILREQEVIHCEDSLNVNQLVYNYLINLKRFAANNNKKLIFFSSPIYNDYCKEDNKQFAKLAKEIGINYLDFTDVFKSDNSISYWYDEIHLSKTGSEKFSKVLRDELMRTSF